MTQTRTARSWGIPVTVLRGERKPGKKWSNRDRALALALTLYEADLCNGCGQPMSRTTGERPTDYEVHRVNCVACAELEEHRGLDREPEKGEKTYVVADE